MKSPREVLEKVFLSGDEDFDNKNILPRIDQALHDLSEIVMKKQIKVVALGQFEENLSHEYNKAITDIARLFTDKENPNDKV